MAAPLRAPLCRETTPRPGDPRLESSAPPDGGNGVDMCLRVACAFLAGVIVGRLLIAF